jgi:hypothetical protein
LIDEQMSEEAVSAASEQAMVLPDGIRIVDVQFPGQERITSGTTSVQFYPAGFSDQVLIHMESSDAQRFTYLVEPLLPKIKFFETWIEF